MRFPKSQLYLIHGNMEAEVSNTRYELVASILTPEERDSGLTEIRSGGNVPLKLDNALSEILGELGTTSFLDDSRRVVVIHDLQDLFDAKRSRAKKAPAKEKKTAKPAGGPSRAETLIAWFRDVLPTTRNIAIFACTENDERQKTVSQESELFQYIVRHGQVIAHREKPLQYEFENHLLSQNAPAALTLLRDWIDRIGSDSGGRLRIYSTIAGVIELTLQAKCEAEARAAQVPRAQVAAQNFPCLAKAPEWKAKKMHDFAKRFTLPQLRELVAMSNRLQTIMYPTGEENYVPAWDEYTELLVMRLTMGRG